MQELSDELIRTRTTLIHRLKDWQDHSSWQDFFDTYWRVIYGVALQSGLRETEAQDVVQETMICISKQMPDFKYNRALGSFSAWLLRLTRWRIRDQFRKRRQAQVGFSPPDEDSYEGNAMEAVKDLSPHDFEALWEREWKQHLLETAMAKAKRSVDPQQYQIFDMYVNKHWAPERVASTFGVSVDNVYLVKHRVSTIVKKEVERIEKVLT